MSLATHIDMTEDNVSGLRRVRFQLKVDDEIVCEAEILASVVDREN